ncbi:MAG: DUF1631 family protein [Pseudomonadota bacterium]
MSDSGIVNLSDYSKGRRIMLSAEHLNLLHEGRDMLATGIMRELSGKTEAMESSLLGLADHAPLAETRDVYFHALGVLGRQGTELFQSCKQALVETINAAWGETPAQTPAMPAELSLLDDTDYEATLAINKSSSRLRFNCAEELVGLDARMGVLLGRPQLAADDNPFGTKLVCEALLEGMNRLKIEQKVQLVLLNQFDLVLYPELPVIYQEINRFFLGKGVLPDFKAGIRNRPDQAARVKSRQPEQTELLGLFEKMASGQGTGSSTPGIGGGGQQTAGAGAALLGISMLEALNRLQVGALSLPGGVTIDLRSSLTGAGGFPNVVRELQQSPAMLSASQIETVMIDAVAMLFDYLFEDQAIPEHLKQLIAKLQVPVLKVAILERGFFTQRDHPARRVLDMIASLAVQPAGKEGKTDPLQAEVEAVIEKIINEFDRDAGVFEQACAALAEIEARRERELESGIADSVAEIQRTERSEIAHAVVRDHIRNALAEQPAPESIAVFLRDHWARLLANEYVEEGESSPHLSAHIETMRELLWSVQNKPDMDSRLMMVRILPGLLKRLREGVDKVGMPAEAVEKFFAELVTLHANAVRPSSLTVPLPEAEVLLDDLPADETAAANTNEPTYAEPLPEIEDEFTLCAQALKKGDKLQLHHDDGSSSWVGVVWVSGLKGNYLFADMNGHNMFSISPQRLADKMRAGQAVLAARDSVTESAFGKLVNFFKQRVMSA